MKAVLDWLKYNTEHEQVAAALKKDLMTKDFKQDSIVLRALSSSTSNKEFTRKIAVGKSSDSHIFCITGFVAGTD